MTDREHDFEPVHGLPGDLPEGENILWQGSPDPWAFTKRIFHVPLVGAYFAALGAWRVGEQLLANVPITDAFMAGAGVIPAAAVSMGLLTGLGWANAKTTVYTITNKRVVMRFGMALTKAINMPFSVIQTAAVQTRKDGTGDLAIELKRPNKIALLNLWPHARPGQYAHPQPTFRAIAGAAEAAPILAHAMLGQTEGLVPVTPIKAKIPQGAPKRPAQSEPAMA